MSTTASPIEIDQPTVNAAVPIEVSQPVADVVLPVEVAESAMATDNTSPIRAGQPSVNTSASPEEATKAPSTTDVNAITRSLVSELRDRLDSDDGQGFCTLSRLALPGKLRGEIPTRRFFPLLYRALLGDEGLRDSIVTAHVDSSPLRGVYEPLSVGLLHKILSLMPNLESLTLNDIHLGGDDVPLPQRQPLKSRLASFTINDNPILHSRPELFAQLFHIFGEVDELNFVNYGKSDSPEPRALYKPRPKDGNAVELKLSAKSLTVHYEPGADGQDTVLKVLTHELDLAKLQELAVDGLHICAVGEMHGLLAKCVNLKRLRLAHSTSRKGTSWSCEWNRYDS